jgi:hypothetical protein
VVPYAPGGNTDILARLLGQKLSEAWGQQVIIDNRPGAAGTVGAELVARAPADGYTLIMGSFGNIIVANSLYKNLKYDPFRDFASIALVSLPPGILVENPAVPAQNVRELIAYAKSNPGRLNYGSPGSGAWNHLFFELFNASAGISIVHVPYKGIAPAVVDLLGGQVQLAISAFPTALPHIRSGKLRALACHQRQALGTDDRRADRRGVGARRLRSRRLVRRARAGRHAAGGGRQTQRGNQPHPRTARGQGEPRQRRRRACGRHAGADDRVGARSKRQVEQAHPRAEPAHRVTRAPAH